MGKTLIAAANVRGALSWPSAAPPKAVLTTIPTSVAVTFRIPSSFPRAGRRASGAPVSIQYRPERGARVAGRAKSGCDAGRARDRTLPSGLPEEAEPLHLHRQAVARDPEQPRGGGAHPTRAREGGPDETPLEVVDVGLEPQRGRRGDRVRFR